MTAAASLPTFAIRIGTPADGNYIRTRWRQCAKSAVGHFEGQYFAQLQDAEMTCILTRESTVVTMAYVATAPETSVGFLVARPPVPVVHKGPGRYPVREIGPAPVVYFLFVEESVRRLGIAGLLVGELRDRSDVLYTGRPAQVKQGSAWARSPYPVPREWTYCPRVAATEVV
jgi:hypothetical protein